MAPSLQPPSDWRRHAHVLQPVASGLLLIYMIPLTSAIVPLRLLDPRWQLGLASGLLDRAFLPLIALLLVHIAAAIDPDLERRRDRLAAWAVAAALGFLLLVPLQFAASWQAILAIPGSNAAGLSAPEQRLQAHRQAIIAARSSAELRETLRSLKGPPLPDAVFQQPLQLLRQQLLASLSRAESQLRRVSPPDTAATQARWLLGQRGAQGMALALCYAFSFAALARRPRSQGSLLDDWLWQLGRFTRRFSRRATAPERLPRGPAGQRVVDADYFDQIHADEPPPGGR